jgi:hydrogenase maturation protease
MKTLIIGLGNPILGDDGVGWKVAEEVKRQLPSSQAPHQLPPFSLKMGGEKEEGVEVDCVSLGGLSLMERMLGYQHVILVDSMESGQNPVGSVRAFPLIGLPNPMAGHSGSAHDTSLLNALQIAQAMGADVPERVDVVVIETMNRYDFSEEISPEVKAAIPITVHKIMGLLKKELV